MVKTRRPTVGIDRVKTVLLGHEFTADAAFPPAELARRLERRAAANARLLVSFAADGRGMVSCFARPPRHIYVAVSPKISSSSMLVLHRTAAGTFVQGRIGQMGHALASHLLIVLLAIATPAFALFGWILVARGGPPAGAAVLTIVAGVAVVVAATVLRRVFGTYDELRHELTQAFDAVLIDEVGGPPRVVPSNIDPFTIGRDGWRPRGSAGV